MGVDKGFGHTMLKTFFQIVFKLGVRIGRIFVVLVPDEQSYGKENIFKQQEQVIDGDIILHESRIVHIGFGQDEQEESAGKVNEEAGDDPEFIQGIDEKDLGYPDLFKQVKDGKDDDQDRFNGRGDGIE